MLSPRASSARWWIRRGILHHCVISITIWDLVFQFNINVSLRDDRLNFIDSAMETGAVDGLDEVISVIIVKVVKVVMLLKKS